MGKGVTGQGKERAGGQFWAGSRHAGPGRGARDAARMRPIQAMWLPHLCACYLADPDLRNPMGRLPSAPNVLWMWCRSAGLAIPEQFRIVL